MPIQHRTFPVQGQTLATTLTTPDAVPTTKPSILLIHGAGGGNRARLQYLATSLAEHGHATLSFDHSGYGDSTGKLEESSLARKLEEARAMLAHLAPGPLTVMGSSMGAHVATALTAHAPVKTLILMVPAAYAAEAENIPFGPAFTTTIRHPGSWNTSPCWPLIRAFTDNLVLVTCGQDAIIPPAVIRAWWANAAQARSRTHLRFPNLPHAFQNWATQNPEEALPPLLQTLLPLL